MKFNVTYEIVTPESAEHGDCAERGFIAESIGLRDAVKALFDARTARCDSGDGLQNCGRWFDYAHGTEFETGAQETRSLHPSRTITESSYRRLARLLEAA